MRVQMNWTQMELVRQLIQQVVNSVEARGADNEKLFVASCVVSELNGTFWFVFYCENYTVRVSPHELTPGRRTEAKLFVEWVYSILHDLFCFRTEMQ